MKTIRHVLSLNQMTSAERKTVVGAVGSQAINIYKDKIMTPHQIMQEIERAYGNNPIFRSSVETITDFIFGGGITFKSDDKATEVRGQQLIKDLKMDEWLPDAIRETVKSGNGYVEMDYNPLTGLPQKFYPQTTSSRWYINSDDHGEPKKKNDLVRDQRTGLYVYKEVSDVDRYYIQQIDEGVNYGGADWFTLSYHMVGTGKFRVFKVYGIPIHRDKVIHFKLNLGTTGLYGESHLSAALDDNQILKEMERSIAVIARHKAVPRKVISYGDKDNPAQSDELDDLIIYLESLERDEDPVVNKPMKVEDLSYAGGDINLSYMIEHIRKKIFGGVVPDFLTGYGDQVNRATAQVLLISFILSIYSKRKKFLQVVEERVIDPWLQHEKLEKGNLQFNKLDFETDGEKTSRVLSLWTSNLMTLNRAHEELDEPQLGDDGDVYYTEWQNKLMTKGMPGGGTTPDEFGMDPSNPLAPQTPFPYDTTTLPPYYSVYSKDYKEVATHSHELPEALKEKVGNIEEDMEKDPMGIDPLISFTSRHIRETFSKKLDQVKTFSDKKKLEILKEDLRAKDVRELAMFLRIGSGDIEKKFLQSFEQAWMKGNLDTGKKIGLQSGIMLSPKQMNHLKKDAWKYVKKNLEKGTDMIEDALSKGIMGQLEGKALEKEIEKTYNFIGWKSEQLAVTELKKAYSSGVGHVLEKSPYKEWKWKTALDEKTCPVCRPKHNEVYTIHSKIDFMPPAHPHCRCSPEVVKK